VYKPVCTEDQPGKRTFLGRNVKKMESNRTHWLIHALFIFCSAAAILPILLVIAISFSSEDSIIKYGYSLIPREFSLDAFKYILNDSHVVTRAYFVTIFVTITGTLACMIVTSALAYPISRKSMPFRRFFSVYVVLTILFNGGLVPWYILFKTYLHFGDNIWALIVPGLMLNGFNVLVMRTFFANTIPSELFESANMDGAGELRIFAQIVIPLSKPVYATIGLFATLAYWNDWFNSMVFQINHDNFSMQYVLQNILNNIQYLAQNTRSNNVGSSFAALPAETSRMAMALIAVGPVIFAYPFFQRYFVKGLTIGAVKG
jgi:putative aldouronate transport system permease protein